MSRFRVLRRNVRCKDQAVIFRESAVILRKNAVTHFGYDWVASKERPATWPSIQEIYAFTINIYTISINFLALGTTIRERAGIMGAS